MCVCAYHSVSRRRDVISAIHLRIFGGFILLKCIFWFLFFYVSEVKNVSRPCLFAHVKTPFTQDGAVRIL